MKFHINDIKSAKHNEDSNSAIVQMKINRDTAPFKVILSIHKKKKFV